MIRRRRGRCRRLKMMINSNESEIHRKDNGCKMHADNNNNDNRNNKIRRGRNTGTLIIIVIMAKQNNKKKNQITINKQYNIHIYICIYVLFYLLFLTSGPPF